MAVPGPPHPGGPDDWESHWRAFAGALERNPAQQFRRKLILRNLGASPHRIADIGCGHGDLLAALHRAHPAAELLGIDISRSGIDIARAKTPAAQFLQSDLRAPRDPGEWRHWATHAVCSEVLEHLDDPEAFLRTALAYMQPGARLVVTVPGGPMSAFDRHIGHRRHYTAMSLRRMLSASGLVVDSCHGAGFPFFALYRLAIVARGERLAADASRPSWAANTAMSIFGALFHANSLRSGWQLIAVARAPGTPGYDVFSS